MEKNNIPNIFSVDLEDWFHILDIDSAPDFSQWEQTDSRLENNTYKILESLSHNNVKATFFILGWVAEKYPALVQRIYKEGHEIASHGYAHELIFNQSPQQFKEDIQKAKEIIENITGDSVKGYRAPGFSIIDKTTWAFEKIIEAGYEYDSSVFPAKRGHGGLITDNTSPHIIKTDSGNLVEFPISMVKLPIGKYYFFGGGYFRVFPYHVIKKMVYKLNSEDRPVIAYLHPRDIDGNQPVIKMFLLRRFKSYVNVGEKTLVKTNKLLEEFSFVSFRFYLDNCFVENDKL